MRMGRHKEGTKGAERAGVYVLRLSVVSLLPTMGPWALEQI
jgi:hypothetical protein